MGPEAEARSNATGISGPNSEPSGCRMGLRSLRTLPPSRQLSPAPGGDSYQKTWPLRRSAVRLFGPLRATGS